MIKRINFMVILLFLASCGNKERLKIKDNGDIDVPRTELGDSTDSGSAPEIVFEDVLNQIFIKDKTCTGCHDGTFGFADYSKYEDVIAADVNEIVSRVLSNNMPEFGPPLSADQKQLLQDWVAIGAPEK